MRDAAYGNTTLSDLQKQTLSPLFSSSEDRSHLLHGFSEFMKSQNVQQQESQQEKNEVVLKLVRAIVCK